MVCGLLRGATLAKERVYNTKDAASFYSGRWNTGTNPDLAFATVGPNSRLPDRRVLDKFPRSQHRPLLITQPRFAMAVPSMPVKRWNFRKAKWSYYIALTNKLAKTLLPPDSLDVDAAYQDFCNTIKKAVKKAIPRGYRNNYNWLNTGVDKSPEDLVGDTEILLEILVDNFFAPTDFIGFGIVITSALFQILKILSRRKHGKMWYDKQRSMLSPGKIFRNTSIR